MWMTRNLFKGLDDLPDKPRVGVNLIMIGLVFGAVRYFRPRVGPVSFQRVSAIVYRHSFSRYPSPDDLGFYVWMGCSICLICGAFIFFRRAVWRLQDRRDEKQHHPPAVHVD